MRAVVLGGGIAGLCGAGALASAGYEVVLVEQDVIPPTPQPRRGVPQSRQLHNLLGRAQLHLEQMFPGFTERLLKAGGVRAAVSSQTHVFELGVVMPERDIGVSILSASQPLVERTIRDLLPSSVRVLTGTTATGILTAHGRVEGATTSGGPIAADVVIDSLGARSPVSSWLPEPPSVEVFQSRHWYTSLTFERPASFVGSPDFWLTFPSHGETRGALLSPDGAQRWRASASGLDGDPVPTTVPGFRQHLDALEDNTIARVLADARPLGTPTTFKRLVATWRHYDRVRHPIIGLLPVGDAFVALNPLLGQGISIAAWQAAQLTAAGDDVTHMTTNYLRKASESISDAWQLTKIFNPSNDPDGLALSGDDWSRIARSVRSDPRVHSRYVRVWHLLEPVRTLAAIAKSKEQQLA